MTIILTRFIYMSKIHLNQSINCLLTAAKKVRIKILKNPKVFINYLQTNGDVYENLDNMIQQRKVLIVFDDIVGDTKFNKKLSPICHWIAFESKKTQYFTCFDITIFFQSAKNFKTKTPHIILSWNILTKENFSK